MLLGHLEGLGRFTHEVVQRLLPLMGETAVYMLFDRRPLSRYQYGANQKTLVTPPPARHWTLYEVWYRLALPLVLKRHHPKVFFGTYGIAPRPIPKLMPTVLYIHDIAFERHPEFLPRLWYRYYSRTVRESVRHAAHLFVNSESVAADLRDLYQVPATQMTLAYSGIDTAFFKPLSAFEQESIRQSLTGGFPYILYVGSIHPRKNFVRLLRAYERLRSLYREPLRLVVVGRFLFRKGKGEVAQTYEAMRHKSEVLWQGVISDDQLRQLYNGAQVVAYPSLYEGFGSPVGEALACGTVVVTSRSSSLPEVGGEAALYADPYDEEDLAHTLYQALMEPAAARAVRTQKGLSHVQQFRWETTAQKIATALQAYL